MPPRTTSLKDALTIPTQSELISGGDRLAAVEMNFDHLFAVHRRPMLIGQGGQGSFARNVDYLAGAGIRKSAVETEGDPAGLFAELETRLEPRRHGGVVEDVNHLVKRVDDPDFGLIRRQADAVAGAAVPLGRPFGDARNFDAVQFAAG